MLRELHISNLAVIADVRIELEPGLNCFTGATGAGKSLVIGAHRGAARPAQPRRDAPRRAPTRAASAASSRWATRSCSSDIRQLTDVDVIADGGELLLTRRLYASGRSSRQPQRQPDHARHAQAGRRAPGRRARPARPPVPAQAVQPARRARPVRRAWPTCARRYHDVYEQVRRRPAADRRAVGQPHAPRAAARAVPLPGRRDRRRRARPGGVRGARGPRVGAGEPREAEEGRRRRPRRAVRGRRLGARAAEDDGGGPRRAGGPRPQPQGHRQVAAGRDDRRRRVGVRPVALPRQARPRPRRAGRGERPAEHDQPHRSTSTATRSKPTLAYRDEIGEKIAELERATDDFSALELADSPRC